MTAPKMTEHKRLQSYQDKLEAIRDFIGWMMRDGYSICRLNQYGEMVGDEITPTDAWLYNYFGIDQAALEAEREQAVRYALDR